MALTRAEITAKCTAALIASRDEAAMARVINVGRTKVQSVPVLDVKAYLHTNNLWLAIVAAQSDATKTAAGRASASALVAFAASGVVNMDVTLPVVGAQLGYLVTDAVITQTNKDAIITLGTVPDLVIATDVASVLYGA